MPPIPPAAMATRSIWDRTISRWLRRVGVVVGASENGQFRQVFSYLDEIDLAVLHVCDLVVVLVDSDPVLIHSVGSRPSNGGLEIRILTPKALVVAFVRSPPHDLVDHVVEDEEGVLPSVELVLLGLQGEKQILVLLQTLEALGGSHCLLFVVDLGARESACSRSITVDAATTRRQRLLRVQQRFFLLFMSRIEKLSYSLHSVLIVFLHYILSL